MGGIIKNIENLTFFSNFVIKKTHMRKNSNGMQHWRVYPIGVKKNTFCKPSRSGSYNLPCNLVWILCARIFYLHFALQPLCHHFFWRYKGGVLDKCIIWWFYALFGGSKRFYWGRMGAFWINTKLGHFMGSFVVISIFFLK